MPTGYTAKIADGISFNEFVMSCARAFGACVTMRDEPSSASIPDEFKPSDCYLNAMKDTEFKLDKINNMTDEQTSVEAIKEFRAELARVLRARDERIELKRKYESMLDKVGSWNPPSPDHVGLKKFMIEQITRSIDSDCDTSYCNPDNVERITGEQWRKKKQMELTNSFSYYEKEHRSEIDKAETRTRWIKDLRKSLG